MILVTGAAGFIGHRLCARLLDDGHQVVGRRLLPRRVLRPRPSSGPPSPRCCAGPGFQFRARRPPPRRPRPAGDRRRHPPGRHARPPAGPRHRRRLRVVQRRRHPPAPRRRRAGGHRHRRPRLDLQRLRRGGRRRRVPADPAHLGLRPLQARGRAGDAGGRRGRAALLLRLRSGPAPRHGVPPLLRGDARTADPSPCTATATRSGPTPTSTTSWPPPWPPSTAAAPGETYNVGGASPIRLLDAVAVLAGAFGITPQIRPAPPRPGDQATTRADTTKARRDLAWQPATDPADGLRAQVAWHRTRRRRASAA